ncbi:MAG: hypothetical protein IIV97_03895, partial [Oscillospiraceae bacterium]|nr:hypothetical protein [Oscillospiraceae bacterium]
MDLKILGLGGEVRFSATGKEIDTVFNGEFAEGDKIVVSAPLCEFITLTLDEELGEATIYNPRGKFEYEIPKKALSDMYSKKTFKGEEHRICVREAEDEVAYGT